MSITTNTIYIYEWQDLSLIDQALRDEIKRLGQNAYCIDLSNDFEVESYINRCIDSFTNEYENWLFINGIEYINKLECTNEE